MNESIITAAISSVGYLYNHRNKILDNVKKALSWWDRPREIPLLKVSGLLFASKSGKSYITQKFKSSSDVAFVDVDDIASKKSMNVHNDTLDELNELELCKTVRELVASKKKTYKHIVLISTDYQRLKTCGAQRCYLCYPSPRFLMTVDNLKDKDLIHKQAFRVSHSILSFSVGKYAKLKRCFMYDTLEDIEQILRSVYDIKQPN